MIEWPKAISLPGARLCVRLLVVLCFVLFGFGGAVERAMSSHHGLDLETSASQSAGVQVQDLAADGETSGLEVVDHGCHGCSAIPQPAPHGATGAVAFGTRLAWAAVPSADGREPLVDLPPPRA